MRKSVLSVIAALYLLLAFLVMPAAAGEPAIRVVLDGEPLSFEGVQPEIVQGRTMVPLRSVFERLGARVEWDSEARAVLVEKGAIRVVLPVDSPAARVNGVEYQLDVPARIIEGRTMVPLRFIFQALGAAVAWDASNSTVTINSVTPLKPAKEINGYYVDYKSLESLEQNREIITGASFYSYTLDADGSIREKVLFPKGQSLARDSGIATYALIFSQDPSAVQAMLATSEARTRAVKTIRQLLVEGGYAGVNLDLEGVAATERQAYVDLVAELAAELRPAGLQVMLSLPAKASEVSWRQGYDYAGLGQHADYLILMAYDKHYPGGEPGPISPLHWVEEVVQYASSLVAPEKLVLGLGVYGYDWPAGGQARTLDLQGVRSLVEQQRASSLWDNPSWSPYFRYTSADGVDHQVWFEDAVSVMGKLEVVKKYKLRGIALWRLGIIPPEIWQVIRETFDPVSGGAN